MLRPHLFMHNMNDLIISANSKSRPHQAILNDDPTDATEKLPLKDLCSTFCHVMSLFELITKYRGSDLQSTSNTQPSDSKDLTQTNSLLCFTFYFLPFFKQIIKNE